MATVENLKPITIIKSKNIQNHFFKFDQALRIDWQHYNNLSMIIWAMFISGLLSYNEVNAVVKI